MLDPYAANYADPDIKHYGYLIFVLNYYFLYLGVIADYALTLGDLIGVLYQFFKKLGIEQLRFKAGCATNQCSHLLHAILYANQ